MKVSSEDFVRAWQEGSSVTAVAKKLGLSPSAVSTRARSYRTRGVRLKHMGYGLDIDALNKICEENK